MVVILLLYIYNIDIVSMQIVKYGELKKIVIEGIEGKKYESICCILSSK